MIEETYAVFAAWDFGALEARRTSIACARELHRRQQRDLAPRRREGAEPALRPRRARPALVVLAQERLRLEEWKPLLLWHMTRDEFLLRDFLAELALPGLRGWRLPRSARGAARLPARIRKRGGTTEHAWTEHDAEAGRRGPAEDGSRLRPPARQRRQGVRLAITCRSAASSTSSTRCATRSRARGKVIDAPDWRMFLMRPADVERELLRLHQFRKLDYQVAGSLVQLSLPCASSREYAERMVA